MQVLADLRQETVAWCPGRESNQVAPEQGQFLAWLVETLGVRRAIELGVFTGYSSTAMALVGTGPFHCNGTGGYRIILCSECA